MLYYEKCDCVRLVPITLRKESEREIKLFCLSCICKLMNTTTITFLIHFGKTCSWSTNNLNNQLNTSSHVAIMYTKFYYFKLSIVYYFNLKYQKSFYSDLYCWNVSNKIILIISKREFLDPYYRIWDENYIFGIFSERISKLILSEKTPTI